MEAPREEVVAAGTPPLPSAQVVSKVLSGYPAHLQTKRAYTGPTCHNCLLHSTPLLSVHLNQIGFCGLDPASMALDWSALARSARDTRVPKTKLVCMLGPASYTMPMLSRSCSAPPPGQ
ncbi:hypothetical protein HU200_063093 [Digitaria exilis]|uniref:Uncharacterized protein n=1 Tax=Digitaria exilis TaxID=1010633 RepID=A0A835A4F6_9POAL|nr:hypothetical protein HU200_063093 [Digitaria exilis]